MKIDAAIAKHGLSDHADEVKAIVREAVRLETEWPERASTPKVGTSRLGGLPDLPDDVEWPRRNGIPMQHVAQIACADLPASALPDAGVLSFFVSTEWAFDDMEKQCARVLYFAKGAKLRRREPEIIEYDDEFRGKNASAPIVHAASGAVTMKTIPSIPVPHTKEIAWKKGFAEAYAQAWHDGLLDAFPAGRYDHRMGGYVQEMDYCNEIEHGDVLLLCLASQSPFRWGDADSIHFVMKAADLEKRDFDRVRVYNKLG